MQDGTRISVTVETVETDTGPIIWDMKQYEWLDQIPQIPMALRRQILAAIVATVAVSTAGCSRLRSSQELRIEFIEVVNLDGSRHDVSVEVEKDGEIVADETVELAALSEGEYDSATIEGPWLDTAGDFVIRARLSPSDTWHAVDLPGSDDTSVGVEVLIENDGSLGIFTAH
ncbi:hypothetical protein [Halorientalis marina]|uniref:hypothetical protein n=1 Tax=Halorientalis marina TaxID=2931976 RepID=UPI001FF116BB|nr:hypothetical protein [Halorientalis marina]